MEDIHALLLEIRDNQNKIISRLDVLEKSNQAIQDRVGRVERKVFNGAIKKVFRIPELVEKILCYLQNRDLLRVQGQSQFKNVTDGSIKLQRKLFFAPDPEYSGLQILNPLLFKKNSNRNPEKMFLYQLMPQAHEQPSDSDPGGVWSVRLSGVPGPERKCGSVDYGEYIHYTRRGVVAGTGELWFWFTSTDCQNVSWDISEAEEKRMEEKVVSSWRKMLLIKTPREIHWEGVDGCAGKGIIKAGTRLGDLVMPGSKLDLEAIGGIEIAKDGEADD